MEKNKGVQNAIKQWTENPIGTSYSSNTIGTKQWYEEIYKHRYEVYAPWMKKTFMFEQYKNKRVLEIGVGVGTDHIALAEVGAYLAGIDITQRSIDLTRKNLEMRGFSSDLKIADAEQLPFEDNVFDMVYSFGVLHHIFDIRKSLAEIHRVLKPGGQILIGLYHKKSFFYWFKIVQFPWRSNKRIYENFQAIEIGQRESKADIIVNAYTKEEIIKLFKDFDALDISIKHPSYCFYDIYRLSSKKFKVILAKKIILFFIGPFKFFTDKIDTFIGNNFGWYLIIKGKK